MVNKPKGAWNATISLDIAYFDPTGTGEDPKVIKVTVKSLDGSWSKSMRLPVDGLTTAKLQAAFPRLRFIGRGKTDLKEELRAKLYEGLDSRQLETGYVFQQQGAVTLPSGQLAFVRGRELIGKADRPYVIAGELQRYKLLGEDRSILPLIQLLQTVQLPALMMLAYLLLASVKSLLIEAGLAIQAVLVLEGKQGLGKTTLAERLGATYLNLNTQKKAAIVQVGGTFASIRDALLVFRDSLVVLDDLCLSASQATQRSALDTAAKVMRLATGDIPFTKKAGRETVEVYSQAQAVITAEYTLNNMSDLTRSVIVPITEQLHLPDALNSELSGAAFRHFSLWITQNKDEFISRLKGADYREFISETFDQRIRNNYGLLVAIWQEFLLSLRPLGVDDSILHYLQNRFKEAIQVALEAHMTKITDLRANIKRGNLAYIVLGLLETGELRPGKEYFKDECDRISRFQKRNCIWLKNGDLGVDPEALLQLVRAQPGYRNATRNSIARELKDLGALVLHRNGKNTTNQTKLWDDGPWGYRIRIDVLEDSKKEY